MSQPHVNLGGGRRIPQLGCALNAPALFVRGFPLLAILKAALKASRDHNYQAAMRCTAVAFGTDRSNLGTGVYKQDEMWPSSYSIHRSPL